MDDDELFNNAKDLNDDEENEESENEKEENPDKKDEMPEEMNLIDIISQNSKKKNLVLPEGNELKKIENNFKKITISQPKKELFDQETMKNFNEDYGIFYCGKNNNITNKECIAFNEICPNCMKNTQKMYGLKPHYLINSMGRVCTYKKKKIYCNGRFCRIEEKGKIKYSINYVCGHSGQCDSCQKLTEFMKSYFGKTLMTKLEERDKKLLL